MQVLLFYEDLLTRLRMKENSDTSTSEEVSDTSTLKETFFRIQKKKLRQIFIVKTEEKFSL